ncbi:hypothetical protein ACFW96_14610 [Streptomyces gardneri]|uniref:hypothetical protein n=1 Tax=Streptomyces gardneri TaxID=66892 RepID=UPI0036A2D9E6
MIRAARQLTALLTVVLCALWSLLLLQTPDAQAAPAPAPVSVTAYPERAHDGEPVRAAQHTETAHHTPDVGAERGTTPPDPHLAADTVAELPAAVEHSVRFPVPPTAPAAAVPDLSLPARGVLAGGPRRERAPPGDRHAPRDSRGPPAPRHS